MYEALIQLDPIRINFSSAGMHTINLVLCFVMFGVALNIKPGQFTELIKNPKLPLIGLFSQLIALPAITFLLVISLNNFITPTVAMGMILVAACPGGNISNFITSFSKGNTELAVGLTATSTIFATITTPFNFAFWGGLYVKYLSNHADRMLKPLTIDNWQMFETVFILLGIPLILGIIFSRKFPRATSKIKKPIQTVSFVFFIAMIVLAFANNWDFFLKYIFYVFIIVLIHNGLALITGFSIGTLFKVSITNRRTLTIETGIHNSGLGLLLLFNPKIFPANLQIGGMIFIVAWWGIWHIVSGLSLATYWHNKKIN